jgi:hypothetical protein
VNSRTRREYTAGLEVLRRRFERYRRTRKVRSPIPEGLWAAAAKMAGRCGVKRTAKALRLNYHALQKRVERATSAALSASQPQASQFIELLAPADQSRPTPAVQAFRPAGGCDCTVELEDAGGDKMRIHLQGVETPDLASLSRSFWESNA